jgi:hypothetical protein
MHKRILAIVTLLCAIPLLAFAGTGLQQINTYVTSPGGSLQVDSYAAQTSVNGDLFLSYSSSTSTNTVYVTPKSGYFVNSLIFDGTPQSASSIATIVASGLAVTDGDSVQVSFLRSPLSFSVNTGNNYIVFPNGDQPNVFAGATYRVFEFIPAKGQYISAINHTGTLTFTTDPATLPAAVNQKVIVTVSAITTSSTLSATAGGTSAAAIPAGDTLAQAGRACDACHVAQGLDASSAAIFKPWSSGIHKVSGTGIFCADCHSGANTGAHPGQINTAFCITCHGGTTTPAGDPHSNSSTTPVAGGSCIACHTLPRNAKGTSAGNNATGLYVQDNNGVRAVVGEFSKWSHHVTGVTLDDSHCVACHAEGTISGGVVLIDPANHMADQSVHLRNVSNDSVITWTPETATTPAAMSTQFGNIDTFCMACHSATGATSTVSLAVQAYINTNGLAAQGKTASPTNPFGDTISNQYDLIQRPAVVDVTGQFNTANPSHHAVMGQRYSGRTRTGATRQVSTVSGASTFDASGTVAGGTGIGFAGSSSATLPGKRTTLFDAGRFQNDYMTYTPSSVSTDGSLGDDSKLHCADCHTVGQFAARGTTAFGNLSSNFYAQSGNTAGISRYYKVAIGAHGANNDYLLRNNAGVDQEHHGAVYSGTTKAVMDIGTAPYLVCFNCHAFKTYGSTTSHSFEDAPGTSGQNCNGAYNTVFNNYTGVGRLISFTQVSSATQYSGVATTTTLANILGIQCQNCHNNGTSAGNILGGIHGAKDQTYTDGSGNTSKHFRFFPGLGNTKFSPGAIYVTGGTTATYWNYSANHDGNGGVGTAYANYSGQTYTQLPVVTVLPGTSTTNYSNAIATGVKARSWSYATGGTTEDINWEMIAKGAIPGSYNQAIGTAGCYTLTGPAKYYSTTKNYQPVGANTASTIRAQEGANLLTQTSSNNYATAIPQVYYVSSWQSGSGPDVRFSTTYAQNATPSQAWTIADEQTEPLATNISTTIYDSWGGCNHHGAVTGGGTFGTRRKK